MQESVSMGVGIPGFFNDPNCSGKETVYEVGCFGSDGLQPPVKGDSIKKSVTRMGGIGHNPTFTPQSLELCRSRRDGRLQPITYTA